MRSTLTASLALAGCLFAAPLLAQQGSPNTTPLGVTRVVLIRVLPNEGPAFWQDMRQHLKPVYEEQKRQGIIQDYGMSTKANTDSENDWGVALTLTYKNWAALDDAITRTDPITLAHYGSAAKRTEAAAARATHSRVVQSFLVRGQMVNDWK